MGQTILITGSTGLVGANLCVQAAERGHSVRALVRSAADIEPLRSLGATPVIGDVTDAESLQAASAGVDAVIHCAALLGGSWSKVTNEEFDRVNYGGTANVLDACERQNVGTLVLLSTIGLFNWTETLTETSPIIPITEGDGGYTRSKRAAFYAAMAQASRGLDVRFIIPGCVFGPSPFVQRSLAETSFNYALLAALRGELTEYINVQLMWGFADDVAATTLLALERGQSATRYLAVGTGDSAMTLARLCNIAAEIAGVEYRVSDILVEDTGGEFGTMKKNAERGSADPQSNCDFTTRELGRPPTPVKESLARTVEWFHDQGLLG